MFVSHHDSNAILRGRVGLGQDFAVFHQRPN